MTLTAAKGLIVSLCIGLALFISATIIAISERDSARSRADYNAALYNQLRGTEDVTANREELLRTVYQAEIRLLVQELGRKP